jgi:N-methylhydantoinase B
VGSGSGYGDPVLRDPEAVARDVAEDLVSAAAAHDVYGVVVVDDRGRGAGVRVDDAATVARRAAVLADRVARSRPVTAVTTEDLGDAELLHPVTDAVDAVRTGGGDVRYRCSRCARSLGPYDGDFKMSTLVQDVELGEITPVNALCSKEFVCRQFVCPGCGHAVAFDVQLRDEEVTQETRFAAG